MKRIFALATLLCSIPLAAFAQDAGQADAGVQPAASEGSATVAPSAEASKAPRTADEAFRSKVSTLEEKIDVLKEQIFLSKSRLLTLQEKVLGGDLSSGAKVVIIHHRELTPAFQMQSITYALDGVPVKTRVDKGGDLDAVDEFEVFSGPYPAGNHQIAVHMVLRGGTRGGVFSYAKDYSFTTSASFTFNAEAGKVTEVTVVPYERGGFTAQLKDRPAFRFETKVSKDSRRQAAQAKVEGADAPPPPAAK